MLPVVALLTLALVMTGVRQPWAGAVTSLLGPPALGHSCGMDGDNAYSDTPKQLVSGVQCVAEVGRLTRGYLTPECILNPKALIPSAKYDSGECRKGGNSAENIAHARAIAQLNKAGVYGDVAPADGVSLNLQWETKLPNGQRPDLLLFDRAKTPDLSTGSPGGPVGLVEIKVDKTGRGPGLEKAVEQVEGYVDVFKKKTLSGRTVARYDFSAHPFHDTFMMTEKCPEDRTMERTNTYHDDSVDAEPGVLYVTTTLGECEDKSQQQQSGGMGNTAAGKITVTIGEDKDGNLRDDSLDALAGRPDLRSTTGIIPNRYSQLAKPVTVSLNKHDVAVLEAAARVGSAWLKFVQKLEAIAEEQGTAAAKVEDFLARSGLTAGSRACAFSRVETG